MPAWRMELISAILCGAAICGGSAQAQDLTGANGGLNSDNGAMSGATIQRVNGMNANGTPRQQDPGASMTNGAGNSAMTPGVVGPTGGNTAPGTGQSVPPTVILHGNAAPTGGSP